MKRHWDKYLDQEGYFISIKEQMIIYCTILDPKTRIEWNCSFEEFLQGNHEAVIRIRENFGEEILQEVISSIEELKGE